MSSPTERKLRKVRVWIKTGPSSTRTYEHVSDLRKLFDWLNINVPGWRFMRVYDRKTDLQLGYFSNQDRPLPRLKSLE